MLVIAFTMLSVCGSVERQTPDRVTALSDITGEEQSSVVVEAILTFNLGPERTYVSDESGYGMQLVGRLPRRIQRWHRIRFLADVPSIGEGRKPKLILKEVQRDFGPVERPTPRPLRSLYPTPTDFESDFVSLDTTVDQVVVIGHRVFVQCQSVDDQQLLVTIGGRTPLQDARKLI